VGFGWCTFLTLTALFALSEALFSTQTMSELKPPSVFDAALLLLWPVIRSSSSPLLGRVRTAVDEPPTWLASCFSKPAPRAPGFAPRGLGAPALPPLLIPPPGRARAVGSMTRSPSRSVLPFLFAMAPPRALRATPVGFFWETMAAIGWEDEWVRSGV